jgi:hypothetical protein
MNVRRRVRSGALPLLLALCAAGLLWPLSARAQGTAAVPGTDGAGTESHALRRGFELGLRVQTAFVNAGDGAGRSAGLGGTIAAGYSFHPRAGVHLRGTFAAMGSDRVRTEGFGMGYWDLVMRVRPVSMHRGISPYIEAGWSDHTVVEEKSIYSRGNAATVGGGAEFFSSRRLGLDAGLSHTRGMIRETRHTSGRFSPLGDDAFHVSSTRLTGGVVWRP